MPGRYLIGVVCLLVGFLAGGLPAAGQSVLVPDSGFPAVVARIKPSVVGVGTFQAIRAPQSSLMGTGFVVADGNHVVTNYHVVRDHQVPENKEYLSILVGSGNRVDVRRAEIVAKSVAHDLAILRFDGEPLPPVSLGRRMTLSADGTSIALTGFPIGPVFGLYPATHGGMVAAITPSRAPVADVRLLDARTIRRAQFDVYQLDVVAYPGNSGSPVYDRETGNVIAVLNSTFVKETREQALSDPSGISFAIPVKYVFLLLDEIGF